MLKLKARIKLLPTSEGGRKNGIEQIVYKPNCLFGEGDTRNNSMAVFEFDGIINPSESRDVDMTIAFPENVKTETLQKGCSFIIRESESKIVGSGIIL